MTKKRILSYDVIRIVAALAVVMVHVAEPYITKTQIGSLDFNIGNAWGAISRVGVQMFVMMSGALILREDRQYTYRTMWKSIRNLLLLLGFWSLIYATVHPLVMGHTLTWDMVIDRFFQGHFHLWYLFMLIGLHLITPILRTFVKKENANKILYFIVLAAIFQFVVPLFQFFYEEYGGGREWLLTYSRKFQIGILGNYIAYYLLGWYLTNVELSKKVRITLYSCGFLGYLVTAIPSIYYSEAGRLGYKIFFQNFTINVMIMSVALFVFLYYTFRNRDLGRATGLVNKLAGLTFGVYVMHVFVMNILTSKFPQVYGIGPAPVAILIEWLLISAISFGITYLWSKIPVLKILIKS